MAKIIQITNVLSNKARFEIGFNSQGLTFDLVDWKERKIYGIMCESKTEKAKMLMWTQVEWESNIGIIEHDIK